MAGRVSVFASVAVKRLWQACGAPATARPPGRGREAGACVAAGPAAPRAESGPQVGRPVARPWTSSCDGCRLALRRIVGCSQRGGAGF